MLACALFVCLQAQAQTPAELDRGRVLYREGLSLEAASDWAGALKKFEQVARIRLTPQVRFHIARCKEYLGRWTEALGDYRLAEYDASQIHAEELPQISEARQLLERRIPRLVIDAGDGSQVAQLVLDGVELGRNRLGSELAVNPGPHQVSVFWTNGSSRELSVNVAEHEVKRVTLPQHGTAARQPLAASPGDAALPQPDAEVNMTRSLLPWILGGVGVVSLSAGAVFYALQADAEDELERVCGPPPGPCPESLRDTSDRGALYARLVPVAGAIGVAALGAAATLWITTGPRQNGGVRAASLRLDVRAAPHMTGVQVAGSF
jgi:tetratricopeptide (TPR) repeat protein